VIRSVSLIEVSFINLTDRVEKMSKKSGSQRVPAPKPNTVDKKMAKPPAPSTPPPRLPPPRPSAQQMPARPNSINKNPRFPPPSPPRFPLQPPVRGMRPMMPPPPGVGRFPFPPPSPMRPMYPQYGAGGSARPTPRPMCKY